MCCMMIWHPKDAEPFTRDEFADFHQRNPHGFGAAWVGRDAQLYYVKGMASVDEAYRHYERITEGGGRDALLHWRLRTSGPTGPAQCHPFVATGQVLVMHNGILDWRHTAALSDTQCYVADVIEPELKKHPRRLNSKKWRRRIYRQIGAGNKLALWAAGDARPVIIGEDRGLWYKGRWYSNSYAWTVPMAARPRYVSPTLALAWDADSDQAWGDDAGWLPLPTTWNKQQREYAKQRAAQRAAVKGGKG